MYRVTDKSLRYFRPLRYSSRDGHAEGERVNRGRDTPKGRKSWRYLSITLYFTDQRLAAVRNLTLEQQSPTYGPHCIFIRTTSRILQKKNFKCSQDMSLPPRNELVPCVLVFVCLYFIIVQMNC